MNGINVLSNDSRMAMNGEKTMSSLEIAELMGKRHDNVMRDIKAVEKQLESNQLMNEVVTYSIKTASYKAGNGEMRNMYTLNKASCELLMMGYSVKYRIVVHQRWQELEAQQQHAIPTDKLGWMRLAVENEEKLQAITLENAELKPQVAAYDALTKISGSISISAYHKLIQSEHGITAIQKEVREWLDDEGYIFKHDGVWHRYAIHSDKFEEKLVPWSSGKGASPVLYITEKGIRLVTPRIVEYFKDI